MPLLITVVCHSYGYREQNSEEQPFSTMNYGKNKHRSRFTDDSLQFCVKMKLLRTAPICRRCAHRFMSRSPIVPRQTRQCLHEHALKHYVMDHFSHMVGVPTQAAVAFQLIAQHTPKKQPREHRLYTRGSTSPAAALQTTPRHTHQTHKINMYALSHSLFVFCYFYIVF